MTHFELTHSQKQIWVGQRLHPESPLYNMAFAFVFPTELRADRFREAWRRVADASDALRTRIGVTMGGAEGPILEPSGCTTEVLDLGQQPDPEQAFLEWCEQRCARPLPLAGTLAESLLVRLGEGRTGWYLNQHHLIADAWSTQLLYRQVAAEYEALGNGGKPPPLLDYYPTAAALPPRTTERPAALAHWTARLQRPGRLVPLYGRNAAPEGTASARSTLELDEDCSRALDRVCRQEGFRSVSEELSRFALFATLLVSWLHRVSGNRAVGFDAPVAGRPTAEAKRALGLFIEMFPFAASVDPRDTFRSLGAKCLEEAKLFLRHALPGASAPTGATASNVVLNYFPASFGTFAGVPAKVAWVHSGHGDRVHALRVQVHDFSGSGRYTLHFDFNEGALPARLRRRGLGHFRKILEAFLEDPDRHIDSVDVLVEDERQALAVLDAAKRSPTPERSALAMFEAQAALEPHRVALREGASEVSFATLRERCEALAAALGEQHLGIEPGDRVAILSRRSSLAVIAILGTLRARAAYVPIDPSVPQARLDHILEDSGARVLLVGEGTKPATSVPGVDRALDRRGYPGRRRDRSSTGRDRASTISPI